MDNHISDFKKITAIGRLLGLSKQESEIFSYKCLGLTNSDIQKEMNITRGHCGSCVVSIQKKLNITDETSKKAKDYTLEVLANELLKYYEDIVDPITNHDTYRLIENLKKMDAQLGR